MMPQPGWDPGLVISRADKIVTSALFTCWFVRNMLVRLEHSFSRTHKIWLIESSTLSTPATWSFHVSGFPCMFNDLKRWSSHLLDNLCTWKTYRCLQQVSNPWPLRGRFQFINFNSVRYLFNSKQRAIWADICPVGWLTQIVVAAHKERRDVNLGKFIDKYKHATKFRDFVIAIVKYSGSNMLLTRCYSYFFFKFTNK